MSRRRRRFITFLSGLLNVLNSSGTSFAVEKNVLNSSGTSFAVSNIVLNSSGTEFNV